MGLKVSDEYTVPLCNGHHDAVHRTGDERAWWATRCIDPLAVAEHLWALTDKTKAVSLGRISPSGPSHQRPNGSQADPEEAPKAQDTAADV